MIVSIDKTRGKIKLSSIIRDTYVVIPGRAGKDKINHAYHYGLMKNKQRGPELAVNTINYNFGLAIKDYAAINFYGLRKVIDGIGGIDVKITEEEIEDLNKNVKDAAKHEGIKPIYLSKTGMQRLNGMQAVGYCRIRHASGGDYKRAERQRIVLEKIMKKASKLGKAKLISVVNEFLPELETSLNSTEIIDLALDIVNMDLSKIDQQQFPTSSQGEGKEINRISYFVADIDEVKRSVIKYIYEDIKPAK